MLRLSYVANIQSFVKVLQILHFMFQKNINVRYCIRSEYWNTLYGFAYYISRQFPKDLTHI